MKKLFLVFMFAYFLVVSACAPSEVVENVTVPDDSASVESIEPSQDGDVSIAEILSNLPAPNCDKGLTPENQQGPYFKEGSPQTSVLYSEGMDGTRLILAGQVFNQDCFPYPNVKLDFWQTDANGEYDNVGYTFRGHQFTDNKGRYHLDTVLPGLYSSRPIEHIHVTLTSPNGNVLTTQLYFPDDPVDGLTVQMEDRGDYFVGYFNFVLGQ